jgi:hypothetical protein
VRFGISPSVTAAKEGTADAAAGAAMVD